MTADELRALQAPLKDRYRRDAASARVTLRAEGTLDPGAITCTVATAPAPALVGLHPSAGGDGSFACAGAMLLEALVGCAGVTLAAVATAMGIALRGGTIVAEGDLDARGTMGVSKEVPVGLEAVRLHFRLDADAEPEALAKLITLTERYCVVYQTLVRPPAVTTVRDAP
jgi:uncharacterized OsmC-like protein